jgi:4-amino-4-deoxy-L-arabinose transferase-like glycosyltransferase
MSAQSHTLQVGQSVVPGVPTRLHRLATASDREFLVFAIVATFAIRLLWVLLVRPEPVSDFSWYVASATAISEGRGYVGQNGSPTAFWPVGYALFLGILFKLFGAQVIVAELANAVLAAGTVALFYPLAQSLSGSTLVARLATLFVLAWPNQIAYTSLASDSVLFEFLLCAVLLVLAQNKGVAGLVLAGVLTGLAALVRPYGILLPVLFLAVRFYRQPARRTLQILGVVYLAAILTLVPWTIRNYQVFGGFVFISTNGGANLLNGNNPEATGTYMQDERVLAWEYEGISNEYVRDKAARDAAVQYAFANPVRTLLMVPVKLLYQFGEDADGLRWNIKGLRFGQEVLGARTNQSYGSGLSSYRPVEYLAMAGLQLYYLAMLGGLAVYLWLTWRKRSSLGGIDPLAVGVVVYVALIGAVFTGQPRFHFPAMPFVALCAAAVLVSADFRGWLRKLVRRA